MGSLAGLGLRKNREIPHGWSAQVAGGRGDVRQGRLILRVIHLSLLGTPLKI
jgi:hypothetical protein